MTVDELRTMLSAFDEEPGSRRDKFQTIRGKPSDDPTLCAFMTLARLSPGSDLIGGAAHDVVYLGAGPEKLAANATAEDVRLLSACGVRWNDYADCLSMFA